MTAEYLEDYPYEPISNSLDARARTIYWRVAAGLQAVDGLRPSPYVDQLAVDHIEGKRSISETIELLKLCYQEHHNNESCLGSPYGKTDAREADFASVRTVELFERNAFSFAPFMLAEIHKQLFQDLDPAIYHPGEYKRDQLVKSELVLNGDSVLYADPMLIDRALSYAFNEESEYAYLPDFDAKQIDHLSLFVSRIWQVHPFCEGNTRTTAVFTILYLRYLGFDADNEPFDKHSRYFRDALVRANYRNAKAGCLPDRTFLDRFFENLLSGGTNDLKSRDLMVQALFDDPSLLRNVDPSKEINHHA